MSLPPGKEGQSPFDLFSYTVVFWVSTGVMGNDIPARQLLSVMAS